MSNIDKIESLEAKIAVRLDHLGREVPDPTPLEIPAGFRRPETLQEQIRRLVQTSLSAHAAAQGAETFEESEDFDVDEEFDPTTPYETFFDPALNRDISAHEFERNAEVYKKRYIKAQTEFYEKMDADGIMQENLYRRAHAEKRGAGVSPAPSSSEAPSPPLAKQS